MQQVIDREIEPNIKITEEEIKAFYETSKNKFITDKKARASVILIKAKRGDKKSEKSARQKIETILEEIKKGSSFSEMAIKHSQDSLAPKGGDLGYFAKNPDKRQSFFERAVYFVSLIHIRRCRRYALCRSRWSP